MSLLGVGDTSHAPQDTRLSDLQRAISRLHQEAERNMRMASNYDERTRWRRFAAQLSEALK